MNLLHKTNRSDLVVKPQTREKMVRIFKGHITGDKLMAKRWAPLAGQLNSSRHHYMSVVLDPLIRNGPIISFQVVVIDRPEQVAPVCSCICACRACSAHVVKVVLEKVWLAA